ncbi:MAG: ATP-binding protein [Chloroflexota bacterium]|nr:ATP-binding protein [Chloroflexota bacterium]
MESLGDILKRLQQKSISASAAEIAWLEHDEAEPAESACPICGGRGWLRRDAALNDPGFGRAVPCACQVRLSEEQRLARLRRHSNMGVLARVSFAATEPTGRSASAEARERFRTAFDAARAYAEQPEGWLLLTGPHGAGKTHLAAAAVNRCIERGEPAFFAFVPDLLDHFRASFNPEHELSYDELFEQVKSVPVLVLDDLGAQSPTPWADEKVYQVLNHRFAAGLPTIVTCAPPLDALDSRVQSRLADARLTHRMDLGDAGSFSGLGSINPVMAASMTFENFTTSPYGARGEARHALQAALTAALTYAESPEKWLLLLGDSGVGKTHLAVAVANKRLERGEPVFFAFVPDLLDHLRYTFSPDSRVTYDQLFEEVRQAPLLILDDLGAQTSTPWANEKLYQLIVHRHNASLPTIITTRELPVEAGDPIASRLNDQRLVTGVPIDAPDFRRPGVGAAKERAPRQSQRRDG